MCPLIYSLQRINFFYSKTTVSDHNKPLYIYAGADSFESIGNLILFHVSH